MREITVDLPMPPSVNTLWRRKRNGSVYLNEKYRRWKAEAGDLLMVLKQLRGVETITRPFMAEVVLRKVRGDLDNRVKALLDFAQQYALILDDKDLQDLRVRYGEAPHGCRLILRELAD